MTRIQMTTYARGMIRKDMAQHGIEVPQDWSLHTTPAFDSPEEAEGEAIRWAARYREMMWPGGRTQVVASVECLLQPNEDETGHVWVGVVAYRHYGT